MKIILATFLITIAYSASAQLSVNQKTQVTSMIATAVAPLKKTITADSIRINNLMASDKAKTVIIDSLTSKLEAYKASIPKGAYEQLDSIYFIRKPNGQISLKQ